MTYQDAARLLAEIRHERSNLARAAGAVLARKDATDETATYALALLLMTYYTGAERIFQRIAAVLGGLPREGARWHAQLLEDMSLDLPGVRPPVLRTATADSLQRFLGFRHVVRNLYAWTIRREEMDLLVRALPTVDADLGQDLERFGAFLEAAAAG